jgi:alpha/beta superfamily hydrolase
MILTTGNVEAIAAPGFSFGAYASRQAAERRAQLISGARVVELDVKGALVVPIDEVLTQYACKQCGDVYETNGPEDAVVIERRDADFCPGCDNYFGDTPLAHQLDDNPVEGIDY